MKTPGGSFGRRWPVTLRHGPVELGPMPTGIETSGAGAPDQPGWLKRGGDIAAGRRRAGELRGAVRN